MARSAPAVELVVPIDRSVEPVWQNTTTSRSAPVSTAAVVTVNAPTPVAPVVTALAPAAASPVAMTSVRRAFDNGVDGRRNWLGSLPAGPVADLLYGAALLVRRNLEQTVASAAAQPVAATPTGEIFVVSTLDDSGPGSLRQAILDANSTSGADRITFAVAGTIRVRSTALPSITDSVLVDGTTAPGYVNAPVVRIDFQNTAGLTLADTADDSRIESLSLVDAAGAGVTIAASDTLLTGNYIGLWGDGRTVEGNRGDGIVVQAGADGNIIGNLSPFNFVLANVISGNRGNGITISGGTGNAVAANFIGTDATGTRQRANRGNGIQLTAGAAGNLIGGVESNGNNPTQGVFVRPPQGNLISGNRGNGVLIDDGATGNQLSGNYIGTNAAGNAAIGNKADGVAVINADYNNLIGTTSVQDPFVFYNVVSGNRGNGLRIIDSDHTVVHANFFGMGADNSTMVANLGDGMLVQGDSQYVDAGGEIPLGNVMSGNGRWGIEIADTAGGVVSFNNFVGQAAFGTTAKPNRGGGILVTSSNPGFDLDDTYTWNKIRTSLIGGNRGDGIAFLGDAHGAEVTDTSVGTDNTIKEGVANTGNGIVIGGNANQIAIGGFQPSVEEVDGGFSVYSGDNRGYGIVIRDNAYDNSVFNTRVGLGTGITIDKAAKIPNGRGGILIGRGTSNIAIGGLRDAVVPGFRYFNEVVGNKGNGVIVRFAEAVQLLGNTVAGNTGSGIVLNGSTGVLVGAPLAGNVVAGNRWAGLVANGQVGGSKVQSSTFTANGTSGVRLASARGITVGDDAPLGANLININDGWGILASGFSGGSALTRNVVTGNVRGEVNTRFAIGLTTS